MISRRRLLGGALVAGAAGFVGFDPHGRFPWAPGRAGGAALPVTDTVTDTVTGPASIDVPGTPAAATRGELSWPQAETARWRPGEFVSHSSIDHRLIALTFDDGPSPFNTPAVLAILKQHRVRATFYLIGVNVLSHPELARWTVDEGHEIGNHSVFHSPYEAGALASQIGRNQEIIEGATGIRPITNRAPGLTKGRAILDECRACGLYETHTNRDTNDWRAPRWSAGRLIEEFRGYLAPGWIGLYHDGGGRRPTVDALPEFIRFARSQGYDFVTVTELINIGRPMPVSGRFPLDVARPNAAAGGRGPTFVDACSYDARTELEHQLGHFGTAVDRRIRSALADLDLDAATRGS